MKSATLDHKALLASLTDEERLKFTAKSDMVGLLNLASHVLCLVFTGAWIALTLPGWQLALLLHGIQIVFLFTLLHETVHDTPFKSPGLNLIIGWICAFLILLPPVWFRYFHLAHHRHTHDPEKDPELEGVRVGSISQYLWVVTGIPVWKFHLTVIFANSSGKADYAYLPKSARDRVKSEARIMIALYASLILASVYFGSDLLLWVWILPVILGQPFLRLYLMAEHGRCPHVVNMFENTRTTYTNKVMRWLAWNMPYHAEHHAYPSVPFHKLPEFHNAAKTHLRVTENGYTNFQKDHVQKLVKGIVK